MDMLHFGNASFGHLLSSPKGGGSPRPALYFASRASLHYGQPDPELWLQRLAKVRQATTGSVMVSLALMCIPHALAAHWVTLGVLGAALIAQGGVWAAINSPLLHRLLHVAVISATALAVQVLEGGHMHSLGFAATLYMPLFHLPALSADITCYVIALPLVGVLCVHVALLVYDCIVQPSPIAHDPATGTTAIALAFVNSSVVLLATMLPTLLRLLRDNVVLREQSDVLQLVESVLRGTERFKISEDTDLPHLDERHPLLARLVVFIERLKVLQPYLPDNLFDEPDRRDESSSGSSFGENISMVSDDDDSDTDLPTPNSSSPLPRRGETTVGFQLELVNWESLSHSKLGVYMEVTANKGVDGRVGQTESLPSDHPISWSTVTIPCEIPCVITLSLCTRDTAGWSEGVLATVDFNLTHDLLKDGSAELIMTRTGHVDEKFMVAVSLSKPVAAPPVVPKLAMATRSTEAAKAMALSSANVSIRKACVVYVNLLRTTTLADMFPPEAFGELHHQYMEVIVDSVKSQKGVLHFTFGDRALLGFNTTASVSSPQLKAVTCAMDCVAGIDAAIGDKYKEAIRSHMASNSYDGSLTTSNGSKFLPPALSSARHITSPADRLLGALKSPASRRTSTTSTSLTGQPDGDTSTETLSRCTSYTSGRHTTSTSHNIPSLRYDLSRVCITTVFGGACTVGLASSPGSRSSHVFGWPVRAAVNTMPTALSLGCSTLCDGTTATQAKLRHIVLPVDVMNIHGRKVAVHSILSQKTCAAGDMEWMYEIEDNVPYANKYHEAFAEFAAGNYTACEEIANSAILECCDAAHLNIVLVALQRLASRSIRLAGGLSDRPNIPVKQRVTTLLLPVKSEKRKVTGKRVPRGARYRLSQNTSSYL